MDLSTRYNQKTRSTISYIYEDTTKGAIITGDQRMFEVLA